MKFCAVVATSNVDLDGEVFSEEALDQITKQASGKPILIDFMPGTETGNVIESSLNDGNVMVRGDLFLENAESLYIVPGFSYDEDSGVETLDDGTRVFHEISDLCFSLTPTPSDPGLKPLEQIE